MPLDGVGEMGICRVVPFRAKLVLFLFCNRSHGNQPENGTGTTAVYGAVACSRFTVSQGRSYSVTHRTVMGNVEKHASGLEIRTIRIECLVEVARNTKVVGELRKARKQVKGVVAEVA